MKPLPIDYSTSNSARSCRFVVAVVACAVLLMGVLIFPPPTIAADKTRGRADRALREGDFNLAEKLYREVLKRDGSDTAARLGLSFTLYKKRDLQAAFDHAARVISEEPLSARAHSLMGLVILTSGDFRRSIEEFRTALSLKSDDARAIAGLAMVDFYENRMEQSLQGLQRAAFLDPYEPDYVFDLGQVASRIERFKDAADAYERFLLIAPKTDTDRRARIRGLIDFLRYLEGYDSLFSLGGENRSSLPFERGSVRPIIKVRVNGSKELLRFVVDTGSGMSVISEHTARRLGIKAVARGGMARGVGGGGRFEIIYAFLSSVDIGGVRVSNVPAYIRRIYASGNDVDGYIGLSVISNYIATVDYGTYNFSLVRKKGSDDESDDRKGNKGQVDKSDSSSARRIDIPLRVTTSGFLSGEVRIGGIEKPLNFIVDTGADISVLSETLFKSEDFSSFPRGDRIPIYGAAGIADGVTTLHLPRVSLGAHVREGVLAAVLDLEPLNETAGFDQVGILGANFLSHFRVIFDFQKSLMRLEKLQNTPPSRQSPTLEGTVPEQP